MAAAAGTKAGINASAPREQRWMDGWLLRFSPGKAKRARCIHAVATGRLDIDAKLALCEPVYRAAGLPMYVRVTPFSHPPGLDKRLDSLGLQAVDDTCVMAHPSLHTVTRVALPTGYRFETPTHAALAQLIGAWRGSNRAECTAHASRLENSPVPYRARVLLDAEARPVACGQLAIEAEIAGIYDVFTAPGQRGRGLAAALCGSLIEDACSLGGRVGYLQVEATNTAARSVYRRLGFVDVYVYHYRAPPD